MIGVEIGVEIWSIDRYEKEMAAIQEHLRRRGEQEMLADLHRFTEKE